MKNTMISFVLRIPLLPVTGLKQKSLTDLPASHYSTLFRIQRFLASRRIKELNKPICLFDGHLRQFAVFVEDVE